MTINLCVFLDELKEIKIASEIFCPLPTHQYSYCFRRPLFNRKLGTDLGPFYQQSVEKKATNIISFAIALAFIKQVLKSKK